MNVLLMINSDVPEIKWNVVRFGTVLLDEGHEVTIFLNGPGAGLYEGDSKVFPIRELTKTFCLSEGTLLACGKCMDLHAVSEDEYIKRSNMKELHALVMKADKIVSY
ncbi:DsrE family protein [Desulfovibrio sp. OttesenSCG-928-A18]|nr:DsrE family protein [Desulfovibrio sp. OttesenSCG-928-A18]